MIRGKSLTATIVYAGTLMAMIALVLSVGKVEAKNVEESNAYSYQNRLSKGAASTFNGINSHNRILRRGGSRGRSYSSSRSRSGRRSGYTAVRYVNGVAVYYYVGGGESEEISAIHIIWIAFIIFIICGVDCWIKSRRSRTENEQAQQD